ncbi:MAG: response regulator transcription factor [Candidatus Omnitrophica bacterium]|nr:response regulator transcription factor [Candidatus Omnitrophota bacterium]
MNKKRIVMVDDESEILDAVCEYLSGEGFSARGILTGEELFDYLKKKTPDLIILDRCLPGINGFEICKKLKESERLSLIPVIMLSAKGEVVDKVGGLNIGADDYLTKPVELTELKARILAVLRRRGLEGVDKEINVSDDIVIDPRRCQVRVDKKKVELTFAELKILELLSSRKGQVFSRMRILEYLWGDEKIVVERTVDVHVRNLRKKLGRAGDIIKNIRSFGYTIEE